MKKTIYAPNTVPTANIAVNKSRLKVYKNVGPMPTYYLQKGQEFSIELFNPTTDVVLAKVFLNGTAISQGGLVLKPGQRVFLERYLDVAKKFLFDTYEVSNTEEVIKAIEDNGDFKVEFYRESKPQYYPFKPFNDDYYYTQPFLNGTPSYFLINGGTTIGNVGGTIANYVHNTSLNLSDYDVTITTASSTNNRKRSLSRKIETGRVEMGSDSNQELKYVDKKFEYSPFHTIEYKMLPISQKINTSEDINVKVYCTQCGSKLGKTDKFCSQCGNRA